MEITINQNENQTITIGNNETQNLEIEENETQLLNVENNSQVQNVGISQQDNQIIYIDSEGTAIGISDVLVNGISVVSGNIAYVIVPTKTSELQNNSGFITTETDPTVPSYVKAISLADINNWNNKQNALVSGSTIKTINNENLLGSGNIQIDGIVYTAGTGIDITNEVISNEITSYNDLTDLPNIPTKVSDLLNDEEFVSENELAEVAFTGSYVSLSDTPQYLSDFENDTHYVDRTSLNVALLRKQDELISGANIKTINGYSVLGSGNLSISGGSATDVQINGVSITSNDVADIITEGTYDETNNKIATMDDVPLPTNVYINDVSRTTVNQAGTEMIGAIYTHGIYDPVTNKIANMSDIPTQTSQLTNNSNFAVTNANNNFSASQSITGNISTSGNATIGGNLTLSGTTNIVESGSSQYGNYVKYIDGTMIVWNTVTGTANITTAWGSLYKSADIGAPYFPATFTSTPTMLYSPQDGGSSQFFIVGQSGGNSGSTSRFGNFALVSPVSSSNLSYIIHLIAIGKWK